MNKRRRNQIIFILLLTPLLAISIWNVNSIYKDVREREEIKYTSAQINSLAYGLLSVNEWKQDIKDIISRQIEEFGLSPKQDSLLHVQLSQMLNNLITQANEMVQESDTTFKKKLRKLAVNTFVDVNELRGQVPELARSIIDDLTKKESRERLKTIAHEKLDEFAEKSYDYIDSTIYLELLQCYDMQTRDQFNEMAQRETDLLKIHAYRHTYVQVGIMVFFLLLWWVVNKRFPELQMLLFVMSILLALIVLFGGLFCPMIEIDARLQKVEFVLMGQEILFEDQILLYQSKSILEVVKILVTTGKVDSVFVGILILAFSVLFPISKLIATQLYVAGSEKLRKNKLLNYLAFRSGKWSMADVMVVAIFMSYVGFNGIIRNQMEFLNVQTPSLNSIATNNTALQPGFILFLAFVLFGLLLSAILNRISPPPVEKKSYDLI